MNEPPKWVDVIHNQLSTLKIGRLELKIKTFGTPGFFLIQCEPFLFYVIDADTIDNLKLKAVQHLNRCLVLTLTELENINQTN